MELKIAVCDDDMVDLNIEKEVIEAVFTEKQIDCEYSVYSSPVELLESSIDYDMAFLDIEMNDVDGLSLAKRILEKNKNCFVFFITNYSIYLDNAFDINAFRYLPKPLDRDRLGRGIESALEKLYDNVQVLRLTNWKNKVTVEIEIASIIYLETNNRHTHIVTTNYDFNAYESFKTIKNRIENEVTYFAQPHQSFFVNMRYVTYYNHFRVVLTYGDKNYDVDMSRRQYSVFDAKFFMQAKELK